MKLGRIECQSANVPTMRKAEHETALFSRRRSARPPLPTWQMCRGCEQGDKGEGPTRQGGGPERPSDANKGKHRLTAIPMKGLATVHTPKNEHEQIQRVTHRAKHRFQWSRGVATCACGYWDARGYTLEAARRNWSLHYWNSYEAAMQKLAKEAK